MKKILYILLAIILFLASLYSDRKDNKIRETVSVINIEIPVRVFSKGKIVDNLKKEDFKLFINGKRKEIAGFNIKRKIIETQNIGLEAKKSQVPSRYFILAMNITNFSNKIRKGVDYLLDQILRKNDSLLVFINNRTEFFRNIADKESIRTKLNHFLKEESQKARTRMILYFNELEKAIDITKFELTLKTTTGGKNPVELRNDTRFVSEFLRKYTILWKDYKSKYLIPDVKSYILFSKHLQKIKNEKWVISFFQQEMFPKIIITGELMRMLQSLLYKWQSSNNPETVSMSRIVSRQIVDLKEEMDIAKGFPTEEITKMFTKVGATFHSVFIRSSLETFSKDIEFKKISTDLENNLRSLTKKTGGELIASDNITEALSKIVKKKDVYYILNYEPKENEKLKKIKIKVNRKKCKLAYDDNIRSEFTKKNTVSQYVNENSEIKIKDMSFSNRKLSMKIDGFLMKIVNKQTFGQISLRIRISNLQDISIFDKEKILSASKPEINLNMGFNWICKGRYEFVIDAKDMISGKIATDFIQVKIK